MTDGTGTFSVTPTMMRAPYSYYTYLGSISTTVGKLITMSAGVSIQHTTGLAYFIQIIYIVFKRSEDISSTGSTLRI